VVTVNSSKSRVSTITCPDTQGGGMKKRKRTEERIWFGPCLDRRGTCRGTCNNCAQRMKYSAKVRRRVAHEEIKGNMINRAMKCMVMLCLCLKEKGVPRGLRKYMCSKLYYYDRLLGR